MTWKAVWVNRSSWSRTAAMTLGWRCPVLSDAIPPAKST
jgi:hypothetical protein